MGRSKRVAASVALFALATLLAGASRAGEPAGRGSAEVATGRAGVPANVGWIAVATRSAGAPVGGGWEQVENKKGITVYTRDVEGSGQLRS